MVAPDDIERHRLANEQISRAAQSDLTEFTRALDLSRPEAARDALLEFTPALTTHYGDMTASLAADWYEESRAGDGERGRFNAIAAPTVPTSLVEAEVRRVAGHLWTPNPEAVLPALLGTTDKHVKQAGRDTTELNARRERVSYARVPTGGKTCAFCLILASRDAVYSSAKSAGDRSNRFHPHCDCAVVRISKPGDYPEGYLPANYYAMYEASVNADDAGVRDFIATLDPRDKNKQLKAAAFVMRRDFPGAVTDSAGAKSARRAAPAAPLAMPLPPPVAPAAAPAAVQAPRAPEPEPAPAPEPALPAAPLAGQELAETLTLESTGHLSDDELSALMYEHVDDPEVFDRIMEIIDERDARDVDAAPAAMADADEPWGGPAPGGPAPDPFDDTPADLDAPDPWADHQVDLDDIDPWAAHRIDLDDSAMVVRPTQRKERKLTPHQVASEEYQGYLMAQHALASEELNGVLLNRAGQARVERTKNFDLSIDIFQGSAATAEKYASDELKAWWAENGRETLASFRYKMFGWESDRKAAYNVLKNGHQRSRAQDDRSTF